VISSGAPAEREPAAAAAEIQVLIMDACFAIGDPNETRGFARDFRAVTCLSEGRVSARATEAGPRSRPAAGAPARNPRVWVLRTT
jgi:hypothetical protein